MTSDSLLGAARVRELLDRHGIRPRKSLGQNFVVDPNTIRKVVAAADVSSGDRVLEIGPGVGSLTTGLLDADAEVVAIEVDQTLLPALREVTAGRSIEIIEGDALDVDVAAVDASALVANLPYNVAATLVLRVLEVAPSIGTLVVMTQREVGERFVAAPGSKTYGVTSVLAAFHAEVQIAARISRRAFYPVPNVDSVLIRLRRRPQPGVDRERFASVVKSAFGQRRKTLRQGLASLAGSAERAEEWLVRAGVDPRARPEAIGLDGFVSVTEASLQGPE